MIKAKSLLGEDFDFNQAQELKNKKILNKLNLQGGEAFTDSDEKTTKKILSSKNIDLKSKMEIILQKVEEVLGHYKDSTQVIRSREELHSYIDEALKNDIIAIDTETDNSLDPLTCKLMGGCIYTPGQKNAYIPVNHTDLQGNRLEWQLTEEDIKEEFERLNGTKILTHNGKFDYQVLKCTCGWEMPVYWDTHIGAKNLNSKEKASLKELYVSKVEASQERYSIEGLFENLPYNYFDPALFALYAATDAYMTYRLYEYQMDIYNRPENISLKNCVLNVEMPVLIPTAEMELNGVRVDLEYDKRLSVKYHQKLDALDARIQQQLQGYDQQICAWRLTPEANEHPVSGRSKTVNGITYRYESAGHWCEAQGGRQLSPAEVEALGLKESRQKSKNEQLENPVNLASPTQLAILLYDVFKLKSPTRAKPRDTSEEALSQLKHPLCELVSQRRVLMKLIRTYIDKIPECISPKDGRVHTHFNQTGTETGRFSSSDPINLQNIPSHEKSIRLIFTASPGYVMVGSDFSSQEPRLLATYSQDVHMQQAFRDGKDLYAIVASKVYNNRYEDNLQTHEDGSEFPEGKERRSTCKSILLGIMYGRGVASIAEQIGKSTQEAQGILDKFYNDFPSVKQWTERTQAEAHRVGYVEDLWGRRRQLPNILLPRYEIKDLKATTNARFNPLLNVPDRVETRSNPLVDKYTKALQGEISLRDFYKLKDEAQTHSIEIKGNTELIAEAERQSINARIQGGAASMSKRAMAMIYRDPEMRRLGFKLLIMVHDELIGECPKENAETVKKRLAEIMSDAGKPQVTLPMVCDALTFSRWYADEYSAMLIKEYKSYKAQGMEEENILQKLQQDHCEIAPDELRKYLAGDIS